MCLILASTLCGFITVSNGALESWTLSPTAQLARADRNQFAAYNEDSNYPDCIFVFGGNDADDIYCLNLTTMVVNYWGDLDDNYYNVEAATPASLILSGDLLYYADYNGYIIRYDLSSRLSTMVNSELSTISGGAGFKSPCMVQNPGTEDQFLIIDGLGTGFATFNSTTNTATIGQSFSTSVDRPVCIVVNNEYYSTRPYFYIFTGKTANIQRLDISGDVVSTNWETLTVTLSFSDGSCDVNSWGSIYTSNAMLYNNLVYIIGGLDSSTASDDSCIISFDITDNNIEYVGNFLVGISRTAAW